MTPREIILANINHEAPPRPGMTFDNGRINDMHSAWVGCTGYQQKRWVEGDVEYYDDEWGNLWVRMKDGCAKGEVCKAALEDWADLAAYQPPNYDVETCVSRLKESFASAGDKFRIAGIGGWIFDNSRYIRKMEVYFLDMAMYPDELKQLHSLVAQVYEKKIHAAGRAGADGIMIGEDMGTQKGLLFSPDMWREFFAEEYARLFSLAHEYDMKVLMHSCGQNWEIVPDLLKAGVDCFQFDQPAVYDMPKLATILKEHKAALWSPVDIQKILPTGNREIIEAGTREMLDIFAGGLICKNYPDLPGIGVAPEWDMWAYDIICEHAGVSRCEGTKV